MRGEHQRTPGPPSPTSGSSPHARGAQPQVSYPARPGRIIPACAGSTRSWCRCSRRGWDHPRMRGEHTYDTVAYVGLVGSSPHARGAHGSEDGKHRLWGIIPACAGSTRWHSSELAMVRDHPRMRGEHQRSHSQQLMFSGIIPACAGSTPPQGRRPPRPRDHPRMRGEHIPCAMAFCSRLGSSPHARGAQHADRVGGNASGIIPACAGSTALLSLVVAAGQDHPRMRGEHRASRGGQCGAKGSSPHARGALVYEMCRLNPSGIIPACAGSTRLLWPGDV